MRRFLFGPDGALRLAVVAVLLVAVVAAVLALASWGSWVAMAGIAVILGGVLVAAIKIG
ncbi:hypothetical protein SAMN04488074_1503 [Lentzea albidocapillata subsp. violacea]|uniref:Uncharacterized protein n=1 Tax=Lentzea albidocapillata subsp. violacea TaxID=128104 RepID=A0A1H0AN40_9PSEU|nr:hypothetical protein SAMN04488074_1503 [Lentzea albidocapillata subsp. violacea]